MTTLKIAQAYNAKRAKRNRPKISTPFNGYLIIPAAIQVIENGIGNKAPTKAYIMTHTDAVLELKDQSSIVYS